MLMPFAGLFAIQLGASDGQIAALSSWPALISLVTMIPGARLIDHYPQKRNLVSVLMLLNRVFFLILALLPFLVQTEGRRPLFFVIMIAVMNLPGALANVAWQSFMGEVIPIDKRAAAFATRNQLMGVCGVVASLVAGWMMSQLAFPFGFQVMFFIGFLLAMLEVFAFHRMVEKPVDGATALRSNNFSRVDIRQSFRNNRNYWGFAAASLLFHFGWQMGGPLFTKFQVQELGANAQWMSIINVATTLGSIMAYPAWARLSERYGNQRMLVFAATGMALTPFLYAASTALWMLAALNLIIGVSVAGTLLLLFNTLLELSPEQNRTQYIAYHNTATNVSAVVGPYAGVWLVALFGIRPALVGMGLARGLGAAAFLLAYLLERRRRRPSLNSGRAISEEI